MSAVRILTVAAVAALAAAAAARADSPPVGPLPAGPKATLLRLAFALTRGETTKALDARTFEVTIR